MSIAPPPAAVLFDLDGTLLDTGPDMAAALNRVRVAEGLDAMPYESVRPHVSHGATALVRLGFGNLEPGQFEALRLRFLDEYRSDIASLTRLFPGYDAVLDALELAGLPWGIVTNKPGWLTEPLLTALDLGRRSRTTISGDTLPERKPHPAPLLRAAADIGTHPSACVYVGDAERDVQAARAAGMRPLIAGFGYLGAHDRPGDWGAEAILDHPLQLLDWLQLARQPA